MRPLARHLSRAALSPSSGDENPHGGCFSFDGISHHTQQELADQTRGMAIANAVSLAVRTSAPRSAWRADDPLGFKWSTVHLSRKDE